MPKKVQFKATEYHSFNPFSHGSNGNNSGYAALKTLQCYIYEGRESVRNDEKTLLRDDVVNGMKVKLLDIIKNQISQDKLLSDDEFHKKYDEDKAKFYTDREQAIEPPVKRRRVEITAPQSKQDIL